MGRRFFCINSKRAFLQYALRKPTILYVKKKNHADSDFKHGFDAFETV
jgi:hypothetical protein